jgi:multiple sugar transport system substrate-binding protein
MYFSGYRGTKHKDVVADVINFFVNDPDAAKAMGTDRGLTSNLDLRKVVDDSLTDTNMKASVAFEAQITPKFGPAPAPPPKGHAKIKTQLVTSAESVQFGKATASAAAQDFVTQANNALSS